MSYIIYKYDNNNIKKGQIEKKMFLYIEDSH